MLLVASLGLAAVDATAQTTTFWDGGSTGDSVFWSLGSNWLTDTVPPNAADSDVVFNNRNGTGTLVNMTVSGPRVFGLMTFDNINAKLPAILVIDTNSTGSTSRSLTLHKGITLQNTTTSVVFAGANGTLSVVLGADNTFTTAAGSTLEFGSAVAISGAFRITKEGLGTVTLNSANSFTGGVTINAGTLKIARGTALGALPASYTAGQVTLNGGTLEFASDSNFTSGGNRGFTVGNGGGTIRVSGAGAFSISGILADLAGQSGALTKAGPGTLTLDAASSYSGGTTIASGTLRVGVSGALGASSGVVNLGSVGGGDASLINYLGGYTFANDINVVAGSGGVLTLGFTSGATFSSRFSGKITLNDDLVILSQSVDTFAMRLSGAISGAKNLTKTGSGIVRVEDDNTGYSGTTTISEGILQIGALGGGPTGGLGSGNVTNNASLLVNRSNAYALDNLISGTGSLTQAGAGTTTLSKANTYSGGTSVTAGSLLVTNITGSATGSGSLLTSSGTTLGGAGIISPTGSSGITIGGTVAPGLPPTNNGVGTLTFTPVDGNATFQNGSAIIFELSANHTNDKIVFAASGAGRMDFSAMNPGSLSVIFAGGYTPALNDSFDLLDWSAISGTGINGLDASLLNLSTSGFDPSWTWDTSLFSTTGVVTVITAVPEPSHTLLIACGLTSIALRRRRVQ
jgi:fibronectin-binding autotransporter adhesin